MVNLNRKVEQLEHILNQGGADFCPHLPYVVRETNGDGTTTVSDDAVCACGRPRVEVHLVEVAGPIGHSEAPQ